MNTLQERFRGFLAKLDTPTIPLAPYESEDRNWCVIKTTTDKKLVGFNLTKRDARILAASQNNEEVGAMGYEAVTEETARREGWLK